MLPLKLAIFVLFAFTEELSVAFSPSVSFVRVQKIQSTPSTFPLCATSDGSSKNKRKRRRKQPPPGSQEAPPGAVAPDPIKTSQPELEGIDEAIEDELTEEDVLELANVASFEFKPNEDLSMGMIRDEDMSQSASDGAIPLPDIREARKKKAIQEEMERMEEEKEQERVKIKRSDTKALRDLMEMQPFADADASYFEDEEYGTVSALLGEGSKPFLGIPPGPLQVGHFIGSLGIILMAFVSYPGFPLTNLPTPLRDALQGGLAFVFGINAVLAVQATFKATERGQSKVLWALKTFSVGGLAVDQLSQLPTLKEVERAKSIKGKRAIKSKTNK